MTQIRTASGQLQTDTSVTDVTWAGAGTPSAAIILAARHSTINAGVANESWSIGLTDFTTQASVCWACDDATVSAPFSRTAHQSGEVLTVHDDNSAAIDRAATITAITDGVRLTPTASGTAWQFIVIAFFGGEWNCNDFTVTANDGVGQNNAHGISGGEPNLVFVIGSESADTVSDVPGNMSFGFATNVSDTIVQRCAVKFTSSGGSTQNCGGRVATNRIQGTYVGTGWEEGVEITGIDSTNVTFTARDSNLSGHALVTLYGLIDEAVEINDVSSPNSAASDWNVNDNSFQAQAVIGAMTRYPLIDTHYNDDNASPLAVFCITESGEESSVSGRCEDGVTTSQTDVRIDDSGCRCLDFSGATLLYDWTNPTFTADGFDVAAADIAQASATTHVFPMLFIGQEATGVVINRVLTENTIITDPVPGTVLKKKRPGDRVELFADAVFLHLAHARLVQDNFTFDEQLILEKKLRRDLADALTPSDVINALRQNFREVSDALAVTDGFAKTITIGEGASNFRTLADNLEMTDSRDARKLGIQVGLLADSVSMDEAMIIDRLVNRSFSEQVEIFTALLKEHSKRIRDDVLVTDDMIVTRAARLNSATLTDALLVSDLFDLETGSLLGPDQIVIEHGIEKQ